MGVIIFFNDPSREGLAKERDISDIISKPIIIGNISKFLSDGISNIINENIIVLAISDAAIVKLSNFLRLVKSANPPPKITAPNPNPLIIPTITPVLAGFSDKSSNNKEVAKVVLVLSARKLSAKNHFLYDGFLKGLFSARRFSALLFTEISSFCEITLPFNCCTDRSCTFYK